MSDVTRLFEEIETGQSDSADLLPIVYDELKRLAQHRMRGERANHSLGTTGLVHEAFVRLVKKEEANSWKAAVTSSRPTQKPCGESW